jgi:hypothetical protein
MSIQAYASWIEHFPDISKSHTVCSTAQAVLTAYRGKQALIPVPNPDYKYWERNSGAPYILRPVNVSDHPAFKIASSFVELCPKIAVDSICGAAKTVAAFLINSEDALPYIPPGMSVTRLLNNVNR